MKLSDYKNDYYHFSGKASDVARTVAFAGIALIWIFKIDDKSAPPRLPEGLLIPTALFAFALACDLLQYISAAAIWGIFHCYHEKKLSDPNDDPDMSHPSKLQWPITMFFVVKLLAVIAGYVFVGIFLWNLAGQSNGSPLEST